MIAKLEFNLPDDDYEYRCAVNGRKWRTVAEELDRFLRNKMKYEDLNTISIETIRTEINVLCEEEGLTLYDD